MKKEAVVVDDIQQDRVSHLYEWRLQIEDDLDGVLDMEWKYEYAVGGWRVFNAGCFVSITVCLGIEI